MECKIFLKYAIYVCAKAFWFYSISDTFFTNARSKTGKKKGSRESLHTWINGLFEECIGWDRGAKSVGSENLFALEFFCITLWWDI